MGEEATAVPPVARGGEAVRRTTMPPKTRRGLPSWGRGAAAVASRTRSPRQGAEGGEDTEEEDEVSGVREPKEARRGAEGRLRLSID